MHSRIYQVSENPIEEFIGEYRYEDGFVGELADYVAEVAKDSDSYIEDLKWLNNAKGLEVDIEKKTVKVVSKRDYFEEKHEEFQKELEELELTTLDEFCKENYPLISKMYNLECAFNNKRGFYMDDNDEYFGIITLDNWVRSAEEGKSYHIGTITDYHF